MCACSSNQGCFFGLGVPTFHERLKKKKEKEMWDILGRKLGILRGWSHQDPAEDRAGEEKKPTTTAKPGVEEKLP